MFISHIFFDKDNFFSRIMLLIKEKPFECIPELGNDTKISPALVLLLGKTFFLLCQHQSLLSHSLL